MSTTTTTATYRLKGVNGDADTCTLCGRTGLKRVAWLVALDADGNEDGEAAHFGTDCAGALLHGRKTSANNVKVIKAGEKLARLTEQLDRCTALLAACEADGGRSRAEAILRVASIRREAGHTIEQVAAEVLADARRNVAQLTAELAAA